MLNPMTRNQYNKIFDNGVKHIECAKILAKNQMFGYAISHLILAIEELIKYLVIMTESVNKFPFGDVINPPKGKSIFNDHTTKHNLIKEFSESLSDSVTEHFFHSLNMKSQGISFNEDPTIAKNRFKQWGLFFNLFGSRLNIPKEKMPMFFAWLRNANNNKNDGFYVDWNNDQFNTPDSFSIDDYATAFEYASSFLKQTEFMKSVDMTDEEILEWQKNNT